MSNIFNDQDKMETNVEESAENMGIPKENVSIKKRNVFVAKKSCKACYGRGYLEVVAPGATEFHVAKCKCVRIRTI